MIYITAAYKHLSSLCASEMLVNPFGADTYCICRIPVVSYCICDSSLFKVDRETIKFDKYVGDVQVSSSK